MHESRGRRLPAACAVTVSTMLMLTPAAAATTPSTRFVVGGAEYQLAEQFPAIAALPIVTRYVTPNRQIGEGFFPASAPVLIDYPGSLFQKGSANQHIDVGVEALDAAIKDYAMKHGGEAMAVAGLSEGTVVIDRLRARLENDPVAPPADQLQFVMFGPPERGLARTLFRDGAQIPIVDITVTAPVESRYETTILTHEYDFWGDFPDRPWNPVALLNAALGFPFVHQLAHDVPSTIAPQNITTVVNSKGATDTSYFVPSPRLPLTEVLRIAGVPDSKVDILDSAIRPIVDAGYSRNDKPGDPRPYLSHGVLTTHQKAVPQARKQAAAAHPAVRSRRATVSR